MHTEEARRIQFLLQLIERDANQVIDALPNADSACGNGVQLGAGGAWKRGCRGGHQRRIASVGANPRDVRRFDDGVQCTDSDEKALAKRSMPTVSPSIQHSRRACSAWSLNWRIVAGSSSG